jgi:osmotically-inducible protein OsmY
MSDRNLQKLIEAELEWDPRVNAAEVGVAVDKGVVTLTGAVGTYYEKLNAERVAMRVKGVRGLAEEIVVRPFGDIGNSDDEVAKRALSSLEWDVVVPNKAVQVRVEKGAVTLTGEVDWDFQRDAAERTIQKLYGVRSMTNSITLKSRVTPENVHHCIEDALKRQGQIHAKNIRVSVDGGKVSLDGEVDAWHDRQVIERAAWAAPGVYVVVDRVTVAA